METFLFSFLNHEQFRNLQTLFFFRKLEQIPNLITYYRTAPKLSVEWGKIPELLHEFLFYSFAFLSSVTCCKRERTVCHIITLKDKLKVHACQEWWSSWQCQRRLTCMTNTRGFIQQLIYSVTQNPKMKPKLIQLLVWRLLVLDHS